MKYIFKCYNVDDLVNIFELSTGSISVEKLDYISTALTYMKTKGVCSDTAESQAQVDPTLSDAQSKE